MNNRFSYRMWIPFSCFLVGYGVAYLFFHQTSLSVPTIIGKKVQEGMEVVSHQGLGLRLYAQREDNSVSQGMIIDQYPRPGQQIRPNQDIFITVASRPGVVRMFDVMGRKIEQVVQDFEDKEISVKIVRLASTYPRDFCIAQSPMPNGKLAEKKATIYVSDGKETLYVMPSVLGLPIAQAEEIFKGHDARAEIFHTQSLEPNHTCDHCCVVSQYPAPGSIVNTSITLLVQLQIEHKG